MKIRQISLCTLLVLIVIIFVGCNNRKISEDLYTAEIGDVVKFGNYFGQNEWTVIDRDNDDIFLISKDVIYPKSEDPDGPVKFSNNDHTFEDYNNGERWEVDTWETTPLRKWLNTSFIEDAFSENERAIINTTTVETPDNRETGLSGGNSTQDKVFILSVEEASKYFDSDDDRDIRGDEWWYLRTTGSDCLYNPARVQNGRICMDGVLGYTDASPGVRPVMWVHAPYKGQSYGKGEDSSNAMESGQSEESIFKSETIEEPTETIEEDIDFKWSSFSIEGRDRFNRGYTLKQTFTFSPWIPATQMDIVNAYWREIGQGDLIDVSQGKDYFGSPLSDYSDDELYYMLGTVMVENLTEGFTINEGDMVQSQIIYSLHDSNDYSVGPDLKVGYQTGVGTCDAYTEYRDHIQNVKETWIPTATMISDKWGPVPCVYVLINEKTPDTPNGPHDITNLHFKLGNFHDWDPYENVNADLLYLDETPEAKSANTEAISTESAKTTDNNKEAVQDLSEEEWRKLALKYYAEYESPPGSDYIPSVVDVYFDDPNPSEVSIHLYDDMGTHDATANWYYINKRDGKGTDTVGNSIDFGKVTNTFNSDTESKITVRNQTPNFVGLNSKSNVNGVDQLCTEINKMRDITDTGNYDGVGASNFYRRDSGDENYKDEVIKTVLSTPEVDELMKKYGYKTYALSYYYDNPDSSLGSYSDGPNLIDLTVDGKKYCYYFYSNNLIRRVAPEGTSDNIKTNDFLSELYRIGFEFRWNFNSGNL